MESPDRVPHRRQVAERRGRDETRTSTPTELRHATPARRPLGGLTHPALLVRFSALLVVAAAAFLFFWSLAFALLPAELMRGPSGTTVLAGGTEAASSFTVEWLRLFMVNCGVAAAVVVAPNLLRTRRGTPLGYWSALALITIAALVAGISSFSIQVGSGNKLVPSLDVLAQPGPYELVAYVLATSATYGIGRWQLAGRWPRSTASRLPPELVRRGQLVIGVSVAALTLLITAAWEANGIVAPVGMGP